MMDEDTTPMIMNAIAIHEMFVSLCKAGFTETQAIYLTGQITTAELRRE